MRRTSASRPVQLVCLLLVSLFLLEPAVLAAGPCAAGRVLGTIDACCCSDASTVRPAVSTAAAPVAVPRSCCSQSAEAEPVSEPGAPRLGDARAPGCRCELEAPPLSPVRDRNAVGPAGDVALERWIAAGADASAAAPDPAHFAAAFAASPPLARSDGTLRPDVAARRGSCGCARHALLTGGVRRLLAIYCSALL